MARMTKAVDQNVDHDCEVEKMTEREKSAENWSRIKDKPEDEEVGEDDVNNDDDDDDDDDNVSNNSCSESTTEKIKSKDQQLDRDYEEYKPTEKVAENMSQGMDELGNVELAVDDDDINNISSSAKIKAQASKAVDQPLYLNCEGDKVTEREGRATENLCPEENDLWNEKVTEEDVEVEEEEEEEDDQYEIYTKEEEDDLEEDDDEGIRKLYCSPTYSTEIFQTLNQLRNSSLFTDLTLNTEDGLALYAHSSVMAALSSVVKQRLRERNGCRDGEREREFTLSFDVEVTHFGLAAVLEFAYTGQITCLDKGMLAQIRAAALSLGVPRVLDFCKEQEEREIKAGGGEKREDKKTKLSAEEQTKITLESIRQLWAERVGCDVELEVEGRRFHAHRVILAASSDYFRGMFTSGMRDSHQPCVTLLLLRMSEFEPLLQCSYSGNLALGWGCVFELACTALQFQFQHAYSLCMDFLKQEIDANSCLDVVSFAEAFEMGWLHEVAEDFVLRNFLDVAMTPKFLDLPVEKLKEYLRSDALCVPSELPVFKAVVSWIEANPRKRVRLARELMGTIQFPLMTFKEFKEVKAISGWPKCSAKDLYESLLEEFCSTSADYQSHCRVYLPKDALILVGGERITEDFDNRYPCKEIWFGNSFRNHTGLVKRVEWRMLANLPEQPRFSHGVAVLKGKLYVVGGRHYYGTEDTLNSTYRYDPYQNSWQRMADMHEKRSIFSLVVLDGELYAIGGERDSQTSTESVENYCPSTDSWSFSHPLDQALSGHAATLWCGKIFISGGFDSKYQCLDSMFQYSPDTGITYVSEMNHSRALHCMETLRDCVYVAGGVSADRNGQLVDQFACEIYDPAGDCWSSITPLPVPHVAAGSATLEGKLYIVGGYCQEDYSESRQVHRYDPPTQRWENMSMTPGPNTCLGVCVLSLPAHLRR
ncbi:kelch-like protein 33 [Chanos chanos]|uniref:Kelch-like protein 33 n=1 Tax=Chanos chanos TaxID=29144 RepID=A0A6J2VTK2_CHACN|nr:kelch-like protein 33 [Chanos chanos]